METRRIRTKLEKEQGAKDKLNTQLSLLQRDNGRFKAELIDNERAREILRTVGLETQKQLQYHIGDITSLALGSVFENPYELKVDFVERRNKTECDLFFVKDGMEVDPLEGSGYGAVDIAAFALRVASWTMQHPRTRPTIILDEPMRFLSEDRQSDASSMIVELSKRLGLQFIIVTHEKILTQYADKVFTVTKPKEVSFVTSDKI